jgi:hypothetical protein
VEVPRPTVNIERLKRLERSDALKLLEQLKRAHPLKSEAMELLERLKRFDPIKGEAMKPLEPLERLNRLKSVVPDLAAGKFSYGQYV